MAQRFYRVNIEITNICNLQCTFCPEVIRSKQLMSYDLFKRTIEQVAPMTRTVALHLMGDPLVHPRLGDFIQFCGDRGVQVFLVTNGVLLREKEKEILLHHALKQVSFSLHSFQDNFKDKDPSQYLDTIFDFTETAFLRRPELFINYRLWNLKSRLGACPQNETVLKKIEERFGVLIPRVQDLKNTKSFHIKKYLSLNFDEQFIWPSLDLPEIGETGTCYGLKSHIGILADGTVVPCCLDKEGVIPLGKIQEMPLSDILGGARAERMRLGFRSHELVEDLCKRCQYIERFSVSK